MTQGWFRLIPRALSSKHENANGDPGTAMGCRGPRCLEHVGNADAQLRWERLQMAGHQLHGAVQLDARGG